MGDVDLDAEYLTKHDIHVALNSVLGTILEESPANPLAELCAGLINYASRHGAFTNDGSLCSTLEALCGSVQCRRSFDTDEFIALLKLSKDCQQFSHRLSIDMGASPTCEVVRSPGREAPPSSDGTRTRRMWRTGDHQSVDNTKLTYSQLIKSKDAADLLLKVCLEMASSQIDEVDHLITVLMNGAANLFEADRCAFFLVEGEELVSKIAEGADEIRVPIGVGLAGHVAKTGEIICIGDAYADNRFNPEIDKKTGYKTKSLLCAPVLFQDSVIAVAQLLNKRQGAVPFEDSDAQLFKAFAKFAGIALANSYHYNEALHEKHKNDVFLNVVQKVASTDICDWASVAEVVRQGCIDLIAAERCTLFLLDKEKNELVANAGAAGVIRIHRSRGIAGFVCDTGETVNITDAYCDPRFNPDIDAATGYVTKSILCVPIKAAGEVMAVAQVINKNTGEFTEEDEEVLNFFAGFAGLHLSNARLIEFCKQSRESAMQLISTQSGLGSAASLQELSPRIDGLSPASETEMAKAMGLVLTEEEKQLVLTPSFNVHLYGLRSPQHGNLILLAAYLFEQLGLLERFKVPKARIVRFLLTVQSKYRPVPYHSFVHAFDVLQSVYVFLTKGKAAEHLTDLDIFAVMLSAILHDVDHMGVNNSFHHKSETPLGLLSSATGASSVLEVHHCNLSIAILGLKELSLFDHLTQQENTEVYKCLIHNILATDMARHKDHMDSYTSLKDTFDRDNPSHRRVVTGILLKCGDLSNLTKPFNISRLWGIAVTTEFYSQGDTEKAQGKSVTPGFDRESKQELAQGQLGFIDHVGLPFFKAVSEGVLSGMSFALDQVTSNRAKWASILERKPTEVEVSGASPERSKSWISPK